MEEMRKRGLRNLLLCTLIIALAVGVFLVDTPKAQAVPEFGDNCAECHTDGVPGGDGGEATKPDTPAEKQTPAEKDAPAAKDTPAPSESAAAAEEAAEEGGIEGLPLIIGGIVFIALVVALTMLRNRK